jgi:hypothetical protein
MTETGFNVAAQKYHWSFLIVLGATTLLNTMQTGFSLGGSSFVQTIFEAQATWTDLD